MFSSFLFLIFNRSTTIFRGAPYWFSEICFSCVTLKKKQKITSEWFYKFFWIKDLWGRIPSLWIVNLSACKIEIKMTKIVCQQMIIISTFTCKYLQLLFRPSFPSYIREPILLAGVGQGGVDEWEFLWKMMIRPGTDSAERRAYSRALTHTKNEQLLKRYTCSQVPDSLMG